MPVYKLTNPRWDEKGIVVECTCWYADHQVQLHYSEDAPYEGLYLTVHLTSPDNVFQRIWYAIRYIFGYKCRYGAWDELDLDRTDCQKVVTYLNDYIQISRDSHATR